MSIFHKNPPRMTEEEYLKKMLDRGVDPDTGQLKVSDRPVAPPIGYKKHPSMVEIVREQIRSARLAEAAAEAGMETFEEADDFDIGDDGEDLRSGYENDFDPPLKEVSKAVAAEKADKKAREAQAAKDKLAQEREERRDRFYSRNGPPPGGGTPPDRP